MARNNAFLDWGREIISLKSAERWGGRTYGYSTITVTLNYSVIELPVNRLNHLTVDNKNRQNLALMCYK